MIVDKPGWLSTPGTPIFGVSIHPDGTRLACGGADHKARIFSLLPVLNPQLEIAAEAQCPKLLCSLGDHFNPINAVCFSSMGRLATGSDDKLICIYELRAGPGMTSLGSSDGPAVENWKQIHALRGHSNSITDLSWSPEGDFIASSSLDNSVAIWNTQTGRRIKVLNGHESFVKGVAWDPVGKYLATLSDDRSVSIWRTEDWTQLEVVKDPFKRWIASTFSLRMSWSPEGQFLTVVNCFQSPSHTAAVLQRGNWNSQLTYFVGHKAPVVAASCNPHLFYPPQQQPKVLTLANGAKGDPEGTNGSTPEAPAAVSIVALGSQDGRLSVWRVDRDRPFMLAGRVFKHTVVDLAWTPDGYHLLACSMDGTVAAFHFDPAELGTVVSQEEVQEAMHELYGDTTARTARLAESAAQLQAEAAIARRSSGGHRPSISPGPHSSQNRSTPPPFSHPATSEAPATSQAALMGPSGAALPKAAARRVVPEPMGQRAVNTAPAQPHAQRQPIAGAQPVATDVVGSRAVPAGLQGRMGPPPPVPPSGGPQTGSAGSAGADVVGGKRPATGPPDSGRAAKRVLACADCVKAPSTSPPRVHHTSHLNSLSRTLPAITGPSIARSASYRMVPERVPAPRSAAANTAHLGASGSRQQVPSSQTEGLPSGGLSSVAPQAGGQQALVRQSPTALTAGLHSCNLGSANSLAKGTEPPQLLEARNQPAQGMPGSTCAKVSVTCNGERLWSDGLAGRAIAVCGNLRFAAVALQGGLLQVYTAAGRRWWPQMQVGGEITQMSCTPSRLQLLLITTLGALHLLDLGSQQEELPGASVAALLSPSRPHCQVVSAKLSAAGAALVTLSDQRAFVYHPGFQKWLLVADQTLVATTFVSTLQGASLGELGQLQQDAVKAGRLPLRETINARMNAAADDRGRLEANVAGSLALGNAADHRRWLTIYVRHLAGKGDSDRLREVCQDLLGPMANVPASEQSSSATEPQQTNAWEPSILGTGKRHLLDKVLAILASNRANQRLFAEMTELLAESRQAPA